MTIICFTYLRLLNNKIFPLYPLFSRYPYLMVLVPKTVLQFVKKL